MPEIQTGTGKVTVLYNGVENGSMGFGEEKWAPGDTRTATVEIKNDGELDFIASADTGDYHAGNIITEFDATIKDETGKIVFKGLYSEATVGNLDIPVGDSETLKISVSWMPPEDVDLSTSRTGNFGFTVNAMQKTG